MKLRTYAALIGALAIASAPFVLAVSGGGFPSRPQFQNVGIGVVPDGTVGDLNASGTITATVGLAGPGSGVTALSGTNITTGTVADARLTSNIVKYTDSGTNFTGGTAPTVGGQAICVANGTNCLGPITCTTACSGASLKVGQLLVLIKGSQTTRTSVTGVTIDTDLQVNNLPAGEYQVDIGLNVSTGANAGGYRIEMGSSSSCTGYSAQGFWIYGDTPTVLRVDTGVANATTASSSAFLYTTHVAYFNSASSVAICWAQSVSNATATTLFGGGLGASNITITRIN